MSAGRHRHDWTASEGPWLERVVLATPAGAWSPLRLAWNLLWIALMSGLALSFVYDDLMIDQRGELVAALVIRTNYDQRGPSFNAELQEPFPGVRVIVENIHQRPAAGEVIQVLVDPRKPTRVRDPQAWHWNPMEFAFVGLAPAGMLIAWAHLNRLLRRRRR